MSKSRNSGQQDARLASLRQERAGSGVQVMGYEDAQNAPHPNSGNKEAPFTWLPGFAEGFQPLGKQVLQTSHSAGIDGSLFEPVDVGDYRVISLAIAYFPGDPGENEPQPSQAEIIPLGSNLEQSLLFGRSAAVQNPDDASENPGSQRWTPLGLVDCDVARVTPVGISAPFTQVYARRTVLPMSFVTATPTDDPTGLRVMSLDFEVASYQSFTISAVEIAANEAPGSLVVAYSRRV